MRLSELFEALLAAYGAQHWWPAEEPFEVIVGAVLTQNTAWRNVERAILQLKKERLLAPEAIARAPRSRLEAAVRPAGFFRQKAERLQEVARFVLDAGGIEELRRQAEADLAAARSAWLSVRGIGPETADSILLYAFDQPIFVIDAYTKRILHRLGLAPPNPRYEELQAMFHRALPPDAALFNEYHALFVAHAKAYCRARARCTGCPLALRCAYAI